MIENNLGLEIPKLDKKDGPFSDLSLIEKSNYLGLDLALIFFLQVN